VKLALTLAAVAVLSACHSMRPADPSATADLQPTKGNNASGTVTFTQVGDHKVRVTGDVRGLKPNQEHGFHIHEAGDCSSGDGMSTKGHFNPGTKPHAHFSSPNRHAGDLPALKADGAGNAKIDATLDLITVDQGPTSVVGRGLIVHVNPDDYKTQPTGNAGARVACAIINRKG
jgi:Cu-Zn family superoxide dismutase